MGPYNAGPKSALFLRVALIKAGVIGASLIRVILKREYHVCEKFFFEILYIVSLAFIFSFLTNFLKNIPIKSGNIDLFIFHTKQALPYGPL